MDLHTFMVNQTGNTNNKTYEITTNKKKLNGKHKANSNSNINSNKPKKGESKSRNYGTGRGHFNDFKKLPKSKKLINSWVDEMYSTEEEESIKKKTVRSNSSHKKKPNHFASHKQHDKLYLFGDSFINANYQIFFKDPTALTRNIDGVIPFEFMGRCITYQTGSSQNCPICLSDDISCGRMVKCGHIFCYQCLLQYVHNNEMKAQEEYLLKAKKNNMKEVMNNFDDFKKKLHHDCPLCGDIINLKHIVPVSMNINSGNVSGEQNVVKQGKDVEMQLMCRPKTSNLGLPVHLGIDPELVSLPLAYDPDSIIDTRIGINYLVDDEMDVEFLKRDIKDLKEQSQMDQLLYNESDEFVLKAIAEIEKQIDVLTAQTQSNKTVKNDLSVSYIGTENLLTKYTDENAYFYYEHLDDSAQRTFLDGQDVNILKKEFLTYSKFPETLNVHIQHVFNDNQINNHSMQYLSHLPLGSSYKLIEINVQPHIKNDLYQYYKPMLKTRSKNHEKVKKQENLNKKKGEKREMDKLMKQVAEDYNMTTNEYAEMVKKTPRDLSKPLPSLMGLSKNKSVVPAIEKLDVNDYTVGERVKVEGVWYTLMKNIWGDLRFEKDKEVTLTNENSLLLEMFNKKMNIS